MHRCACDWHKTMSTEYTTTYPFEYTRSVGRYTDKTTQDEKHVFGSHFLDCLMSAKATRIHQFRLGTFCFCRVCNAVQQHNSNTYTYITTFAIFNMVPVYLGLGPSYGLQCHWRRQRHALTEQTTRCRWVRGQF